MGWFAQNAASKQSNLLDVKAYDKLARLNTSFNQVE
jgi:hypothetical protein